MIEFIPYNYQKKGIDETSKSDIHGLLCFPGAGKTAMSLSTMYHYRDISLVIVPLSILYTTWLTEHSKWSQFKNLSISLLHGPDRDENFHKKSAVHLINPEGLPWLIKKIEATKKFPWKNLFVDESAKFKNPKSKRFKLLKKMLKAFKRRYILTGNITPNSFEDLWGQIYILDLGKRLGKSPYAFKNKYFYPTDYMRFNWELKPGAKEEIIAKICDIVTIISFEDSGLELPDRHVIDIKYQIGKKAREYYDAMEKQLFFNLSDYEGKYYDDIEDADIILAPNKGVALMKCWQISQGFLYETLSEEQIEQKVERKTIYLHNEIIPILKEKIEELTGEPCIVAYYFEEDLNRLKKEFPEAPIAGKGLLPQGIQDIEKGWNSDKFPVVLAHINKLSHGLNLQYGSGKTIILYTLTYNFDTFDQLCYRLQRQGSVHKRIMIIRLIAEDTVAEAMIDALDCKGRLSKDFIKSLIDYKNKKE